MSEEKYRRDNYWCEEKELFTQKLLGRKWVRRASQLALENLTEFCSQDVWTYFCMFIDQGDGCPGEREVIKL